MNAAQCRAARALLDWSQTRLAEWAGIGLSTVVDFEKGRREVSAEGVRKMLAALRAEGIEFTNGDHPGVRMVRVDWRDLRLGKEPPEGARVMLSYIIGMAKAHPAVFDNERREWRLDSGQVVSEQEAWLWAPGPWPVYVSK